jgi:RHS repeat-associated protein
MAAKTVRTRYDYDPYGTRTKLSGNKDATLGFTGHFTHSPTALSFAPLRAYSGSLGRWISQDPVDIEGGLNLYGYSYNNPTVFKDPEGSTPVGGGALGGSLGAAGGTLVLPGFGTIGLGSGGAAAGAAVGGGLGVLVGGALGDWISNLIPQSHLSQRGKGRQRDSGLEGVPDEEIRTKARDPKLSPAERQRYIKEEKARGLRNKKKRNELTPPIPGDCSN